MNESARGAGNVRGGASLAELVRGDALWPAPAPADSLSAGPTATSPVAAPRADWGLFPLLSLVGMCGLALVAFADIGGRDNAGWATPLFWVALLVLFVPVALRLLAVGASRGERIGLVAMLGGALYLVKVLRDPLGFTYFDEFEHWPTADSILRTHHLFHQNSVLPIGPLFPGLENVVSALASLGGLSIFSAGVVILGMARLVFVLALYLLYEWVGHSPRVAGLAVLLYMTNPNFLFFDAEFGYESLSLPLAALALFLVARRVYAPVDGRWGLNIAASLGIGAVVVTHHLTSYALAAILLLWAVAALYTARRARAAREWAVPGVMAVVAVAAIGAWFLLVASPVAPYLLRPLTTAVDQFVHLLSGQRHARTLFRGATGQSNLWDEVTGYASVLLILLGLPFGLWQLWRGRRTRISALALVLATGAFAYPASLGLRLTSAGTETSNRSSEFIFFGIAFVLAVGVVEVWARRGAGWARATVLTAWAATIFVGGITVGTAPYARLPGPYLAGSDQRSVDPGNVGAAEWARAYLKPGSHILTDHINMQLMGSYGLQAPQKGNPREADVGTVFLSRRFDAGVRALIRSNKIRYLVVDRRLSSALPLVGYYYSSGEPGAFAHITPVDPWALRKFDYVRGVSRVFDGGGIKIYDVGSIAGCAGTTPGHDPCASRVPPAARAAVASIFPRHSAALDLLGLVAAALLVLVLPGLSLVAALFPRDMLDTPQKLLLVPGLSLVVAIMGGLLLNLTPWGLQATSWAAFLGGFTLIVGTGAFLGRRWWVRGQGYLSITRARPILSFRRVVPLALAALLTVGVVGGERTEAARQQTPDFTQLWLLPRATQGHYTAVRVGMHSVWLTRTTYSLQVSRGDRVLRVWAAITLAPGGAWEGTVPVSSKDRGEIRANLFLLDQQALSRRKRPRSLFGLCLVDCASLRGAGSTSVYRQAFLWPG